MLTITLTAIDLAPDPTTPAWVLAAIEEASGRLGEPRAWRWQAGEQRGTVMHFARGKIGNREFFIAIQDDVAIEAPLWSETPFAGVPEGITAAIERHFRADV